MQSPSEARSSGSRKTSRSAKKVSREFKPYIQKVLAQVHPDAGINGSALAQMNLLVEIFLDKMVSVSVVYARIAGTQTVAAREVQGAVRTLLENGTLSKHAVSEATKAVNRYSTAKEAATKPPSRKEAKAGLQFSISRVEKRMRRSLPSGFRLGESAPIYLAGVTEYITAEILELSGNASRDDKVVRITPRHLMLAVVEDEDLDALIVGKLKITFHEAGVKIDIDEKVLEQKKYKKKVNGSYDYTSGAKAIKLIKKQQNATDLLGQTAPFERSVRATMTLLDPSHTFRLSDGVVKGLQAFIELRAVEIFAQAMKAALHADRITVSPEDVSLCSGKKGVAQARDPVPEEVGVIFAHPSLERLARRGGVKRVMASAFPVIRNVLYAELKHIMFQAIVIVQHKNAQTINIPMVVQAIKFASGREYLLTPKAK